MTDDAWRDRIVGARMAVDDEFADRVEASSFSRQQWSLVMTATEFDIEDAEDPERAHIVATTDQLDSVIPELDEIETQMQSMGGGGGQRSGGSGGGIFSKIKDTLGLQNGSKGSEDDERKREAVQLVGEYAEMLQEYLEERGRWEEIRSIAAGE